MSLLNRLIAVARAPREICSWLSFRLWPGRAKLAHLKRFTRDDGGQRRTIVVLGTIHYDHVRNRAFPLSDLRAAMERLAPDMVLVEIRPESILDSKFGEGPIEMPFAALTALELGIEVDGIDVWLDDFDDREDHMVDLVLAKSRNKSLAFVLVGYSHVPGFVQRITAAGYGRSRVTRAEGDRMLPAGSAPIALPAGFAAAIRASAQEAREGRNDYSTAWADKRERLLEILLSQ